MQVKKKIALAALIAGIIVSTGALANHSWSTYHWARTVNPMPLIMVDSVTGGGSGATEQWDYTLDQAQAEWNRSNVLDLRIEQGDESSRARRKCSAITGKLRACNASYGQNGWLGLASINLDSNGHITQGTAKENDSYGSYWDANPGERENVMCQEIGHVFGLDHTSTDGSDQNTCMDYSNSTTVTGINQHDIQQLADMYAHLDTYDSFAVAGGSTGGTCNSPPGKGCNKNSSASAGETPPMGVRVKTNGRTETWVSNDGRGGLWIHFLILAPEDE
jgi:hypothetical protein